MQPALGSQAAGGRHAHYNAQPPIGLEMTGSRAIGDPSDLLFAAGCRPSTQKQALVGDMVNTAPRDVRSTVSGN